ncbi:MAG: bifunctional pyrimidine regulatory protein PyrR/uracil phosphoribosyltransferase, partial [Candidatus Aminicenantes bacterium]|nr:bifunctional pyrimidine regulatory protein PyrR/uracil phosphoribosyltransferase [Candidatus Aminicenantes bacterium]
MLEKTKARIMDATKIRRVLARIATEIIERNRNLRNLAIVGLKPRGVTIGRRIAGLVAELEGVDIPVGIIDISRYRDDVPAPRAKASRETGELPFAVG